MCHSCFPERQQRTERNAHSATTNLRSLLGLDLAAPDVNKYGWPIELEGFWCEKQISTQYKHGMKFVTTICDLHSVRLRLYAFAYAYTTATRCVALSTATVRTV